MCILCDSGDRYLSKCFNDDWMKDMGYLGLEERLGTVRELMQFKHRRVEFAQAEETLSHVAQRMNQLGISQMPVTKNNGGQYMMIHEGDLLQGLVSGKCTPEDTVLSAAKPMQGHVSLEDSLSRVQEIFDHDNIAVVLEHDDIVGVISKIDIVEFLAART